MRLKTQINIVKMIKLGIAGALLFIYTYPEYLKKPFYQRLYGKPYDKQLNVWEKDVFFDLSPEQSKPFSRNYNGVDVTFLPQKGYEIAARIGILDRYDTFWEAFAHGYDQSRKIYNSFSPLDLVLVHGNSAYHKKFNQCFKHEYRLLWPCPDIDTTYYNNYHIIPANANLRKGLETLHKGDIVYIKGLLVNVQVPDWNLLKTGTSHNMIHQDLFAGGLYTGMCFLVYLQKLIANNHVYE